MEVPSRAKPWMLALEPRIVLDAAMADTVADTVHHTIHQDLADQYVGTNFTDKSDLRIAEVDSLDSGPVVANPEAAANSSISNQVIFISHNVLEPAGFLKDIPDNAEVLILDRQRDGV